MNRTDEIAVLLRTRLDAVKEKISYIGFETNPEKVFERAKEVLKLTEPVREYVNEQNILEAKEKLKKDNHE